MYHPLEVWHIPEVLISENSTRSNTLLFPLPHPMIQILRREENDDYLILEIQ